MKNQPLLTGFKTRTEHGGSLARGRRKAERPIDPKRPLHVVVRSSYAKGEWSFLSKRHARFIQALCSKVAGENDVRIYEYANGGNHLHLLVQPRRRSSLQKFLRIISGVIAQRVTGAKKGKPFGKRFWDELAYSRIVEWGKAFTRVRSYIIRNVWEAEGEVEYEPRDPRKRREHQKGPSSRTSNCLYRTS